MRLSVAPVFPIWLIIVVVLLTVGLRIAAVIRVSRRHGRAPDRRGMVRLGAGLLAILCLGLAALRIGDESGYQPPAPLAGTADGTNVNVFLVVDRSAGMTARDFGDRPDLYERMGAAIADMTVILQKNPKARFTILSYADAARVDWPISADTWSLSPFIDNFSAYGTSMSGTIETSVAAAGPLLQEHLAAAVDEYPNSANAVYLFSAASDPGDWAFDIAPGLISGGAVFGYGTEAGANVIVDSEVVKSTLNETALRTAAGSLEVPFVHRERGLLSPDDLEPVATPAVDTVKPVIPDVPHPHRTEWYWVFTLAAAVLFGVELYGLMQYRLRRSRGVVRR